MLPERFATLTQVVYSEFLDLVNTGNVRQARIDESLQKVYFSVRPLQPAEQQDAAALASTSGALNFSLFISLYTLDFGGQLSSLQGAAITISYVALSLPISCRAFTAHGLA